MRIAMISEHASPLAAVGGLDAGGQNIYVAQVAGHLARLGHTVDVFTRKEDAKLPLVVEIAPGIRVVNVIAGPQLFVPKEELLGFMPAFSLFCEAWMRRAPRYDVIHANFCMSGWVGARLKRIFGMPLVTSFHALGKVQREHLGDDDGFLAVRIAIENAVVGHSDRIIAACPQDVVDLERMYGTQPTRIEVVPCGFDSREFAPLARNVARSQLSLADEEFIILQLGQMVPREGVETVVRAIAGLKCSDVRLRIVGGDCDVEDRGRTAEIARLIAIARECDVADRVVFQGCKARGELRRWYAASDVFVTTPWYEPFGTTSVEAMACARPVIGSRVGGLQHSIDDGVTGLLVPPKDPVALASAIAFVLANPEAARRMGEAGLERARRHFTWEGIARQLLYVYACVAHLPAPRQAQGRPQPYDDPEDFDALRPFRYANHYDPAIENPGASLPMEWPAR